MVPTLLLLFACVDYDIYDPEESSEGSTVHPPGQRDSAGPGEPELPHDTEDTGPEDVPDDPPDTGEDEPDLPWDYLHPPKGQPPNKTRQACGDGVTASFSPDEIYVLSWDPITATGALSAPEQGWYHVFNQYVAESGATQRNESAFFRVTNATHPTGEPRWGNCGDDWVLPDQDNNGTNALYYYIGTFWLDAGDNALTMHHYCPEYRSGTCTWMHDAKDSSTTCDSDNANSVHFNGSGLCVTPAN